MKDKLDEIYLVRFPRSAVQHPRCKTRKHFNTSTAAPEYILRTPELHFALRYNANSIGATGASAAATDIRRPASATISRAPSINLSSSSAMALPLSPDAEEEHEVDDEELLEIGMQY